MAAQDLSQRGSSVETQPRDSELIWTKGLRLLKWQLRKLRRFVIEDFSLSLLFCFLILVAAVIAFTYDSDNRSVILVGGAAAFATSMAAHESVQLRRISARPAIVPSWKERNPFSAICFANVGQGIAFLRDFQVEVRYKTTRPSEGRSPLVRVALESGEQAFIKFGDDTAHGVKRHYEGFESIRFQAKVADAFGRRLLDIDEVFTEPLEVFGELGQDWGIWYITAGEGTEQPWSGSLVP